MKSQVLFSAYLRIHNNYGLLSDRKDLKRVTYTIESVNCREMCEMRKSEQCKENMLGYLMRYGDKEFSELKFGEVDGLILSQLSYFKFDGLVPKLKDMTEGIPLRKLLVDKNWKNLFSDDRYSEDNRQLFRLLLKSKRFGNMRLNYHADVMDSEREVQFSAITFILKNAPVCIAFRGTDENIIGWKENFNMLYRTPVPAQEYAAAYVNRVAEMFQERIILCGHSKGGNLAVFAGTKCLKHHALRIERIYNYDGPGFWNTFLQNREYKKILLKVRKYVTQESIIGYLLWSSERVSVVASCEKGIRQHYPYAFKVHGTGFAKVAKHGTAQKTVEEWNSHILAMSPKETRLTVDTIYSLLKMSDTERVQDLKKERLQRAFSTLGVLRQMDRETTKLIREAFSLLTYGDASSGS